MVETRCGESVSSGALSGASGTDMTLDPDFLSTTIVAKIRNETAERVYSRGHIYPADLLLVCFVKYEDSTIYVLPYPTDYLADIQHIACLISIVLYMKSISK